MDKTLSTVAKSFLSLVLVFNALDAFAQSGGGSSVALYTLAVIGLIVLIVVIIQVSDNLLHVEAEKRNVHREGIGLFPKLAGLFSPSLPAHLKGKDLYLLSHGHNINLEGVAAPEVADASGVTRYALQPGNWRGIAPIPKMMVQVGDSVKAGQPLFFDKGNDKIKYVAPVSGELIEINRGAKRAISEVVILADKEQQFHENNVPNLESASREELVDFLCESGGWTLIRQRPYEIVAEPEVVPANVFISTFDTAPLAPDVNLAVDGRGAQFQKGLDVLAKLTSGKVHLSHDGRKGRMPADEFVNATGVEHHYFRGAHPAGNVGVQAHHIAPVSANKKIWVLGVQEVITLGSLFLNGQFDTKRVIVLCGEQLNNAHYVRTYAGANVGELIEGNLNADNVRIVSGDVLSGKTKSKNGYLNMFDDQLTVLAEGNKYEMFGWLVPAKARPSAGRTYLTGLIPGMKYSADTNTHGEKRAFVVTGQYEDVLPMDIYPQHLMKAIMIKDIERMEGLGIHEMTEEDIAICEFACTSKMPLQEILREGLDLMREQG